MKWEYQLDEGAKDRSVHAESVPGPGHGTVYNHLCVGCEPDYENTDVPSDVGLSVLPLP